MVSLARSLAFVGLISLLPVLILADETASDVAVCKDDPEEKAPIVTFHWIDSRQDVALWTRVQSAFRNELAPDKAEPDTLTFAYKYLKRVGISNNSALVILGYRVREHPAPDEQGEEYFLAFNYDLVSGSLSKIVNPEHPDLDALYMWHWKFARLARFETSPVPDVVFTYLTCWECEAEKIRGALHYDSTTHAWQIRAWGSGKPEWWMISIGLVVDADVSDEGNTASYDCLYRILDLNGHGFDDVAIRCKQVNEHDQGKVEINDSTVLYTLKGDRFTGDLVTSEDQRRRIWSQLCRTNPRNKLCMADSPNSGGQGDPARHRETTPD